VSAIWYFQRESSEVNSVQKGPVTFVLARTDDGYVRIIHAENTRWQTQLLSMMTASG